MRELFIPATSMIWFIHYWDARDANQALERREHMIGEDLCVVEAAAGWLQYEEPDPQARIIMQKEQALTASPASNYNRDLNVDCWEHVCKYLELEDLCAVSETSVAAHEAATHVAKQRVHTLVFNFDMDAHTMLNARVMATFGAAVKTVKVHCDKKHIGTDFNLKSTFFHNVINRYGANVVSLRWPLFGAWRIARFGNLKALKSIQIDNAFMCWDDVINMKCLSWVHGLELINVTFNHVVWSTILHRMPRSRALSVQHSIGFDMAQLIAVPSLQALYLRNWDRRNLVEHVPTFRKLTFLSLCGNGDLLNEADYMHMVGAYQRQRRHLTIRSRVRCVEPTIPISVLEANKDYVKFVLRENDQNTAA